MYSTYQNETAYIMRHLLNEPEMLVEEYLDGLIATHGSFLRRLDSATNVVVKNNTPLTDQVGIVTGGGSGHEPALSGYIGPGLLSGAAVGNMFTAPSADTIKELVAECDGGEGVLAIVANFEGDRLNFETGIELAEASFEAEVRRVIVDDDVATRDTDIGGRGLCGMVLVIKAAGAMASAGASLAEVERVARKATDRVATMGVGLTVWTQMDGTGKPVRSLPTDEVEFGVGVHGETAAENISPSSADEITNQLADRILNDLNIDTDSTVATMVNGMGGTPLAELYVVNRRLQQILTERDINVHRQWVGEYATTRDAAGCSITLLELDEELISLIDEPAHSPGLTVPESK